DPGEIVAVAGALENPELVLDRFSRERIAAAVIEREELPLAGGRDRKGGHQVGERLAAGPARFVLAGQARGVTGDQRVTSETFAGKEERARETERRIEPALEGGLEARDLDAELLQQSFGDLAVERLRRLQRLAAAITYDQAAIEGELVALGMAAEIV